MARLVKEPAAHAGDPRSVLRTHRKGEERPNKSCPLTSTIALCMCARPCTLHICTHNIIFLKPTDDQLSSKNRKESEGSSEV